MRIKTLLCAAGIAALAIPAMAQTPVYSLNVVGYMNVPLTNQYTLIANQLDADGTGTNNNIGGIFGNPAKLPANSIVYAYLPGSGYVSTTWGGTKWSGTAANSNNVNKGLQPGKGVFVYVGASQTNVTLVGTVVQGTNTLGITAGYQILSSIAPIGGYLTTNLNYVQSVNDIVFQYHNGYSSKTWSGTKWSGTTAPLLNPGEAFFLYSVNGNTNWTQTFTVQ